jgi:hypothetical protein
MEEKMADRNEFHNDLEVFCSAKEHKGMVLELSRVYGTSMTLKEVLDDINYQLDKYENLMFSHHLDDVKNRLTGAMASTINDIKERK